MAKLLNVFKDIGSGLGRAAADIPNALSRFGVGSSYPGGLDAFRQDQALDKQKQESNQYALNQQREVQALIRQGQEALAKGDQQAAQQIGQQLSWMIKPSEQTLTAPQQATMKQTGQKNALGALGGTDTPAGRAATSSIYGVPEESLVSDAEQRAEGKEQRDITAERRAAEAHTQSLAEKKQKFSWAKTDRDRAIQMEKINALTGIARNEAVSKAFNVPAEKLVEWQQVKGTDGRIILTNTATGDIKDPLKKMGTTVNVRNIPAGEMDSYIKLSDFQSKLAQLKDTFNPEYVGPVQGRWKTFAEKWMPDLGGVTDAGSAYRMIAKMISDDLLRLKSGAQINEQEYARMMQFLPGTDNVSDSVHLSRLNTLISIMGETKAIREDSYRKFGYWKDETETKSLPDPLGLR